MTPSINAKVEATIERVVQEQFVHMMGAGVGRYKQYHESEPEEIDGYQFTYAVDEFLGPQGVGCVFRFYLRKDGQTFSITDGHGPGYKEGPEHGWVEVIDNKPI